MKLEKITNVAVILTAAILIGTVLYDRLSPRRPPLRSSPQNLVGKTLNLPKSLNAGSTATVVLFVSKNCHFCSESMPFYRRLATLRERGPNGLRLLAVVPSGRETGTEAESYFTQHEVSVDGVGEMEFATLGVWGTPTLALLDESSRVLAVWTGVLSSAKEDEVIGKIRGMCRGCVGGA